MSTAIFHLFWSFNFVGVLGIIDIQCQQPKYEGLLPYSHSTTRVTLSKSPSTPSSSPFHHLLLSVDFVPFSDRVEFDAVTFSAHPCPLSFSISTSICIHYEMLSPLQKPFLFSCSLTFLHLPHSSHLFWKRRGIKGVMALGWWKWICAACHVLIEMPWRYLLELFFIESAIFPLMSELKWKKRNWVFFYDHDVKWSMYVWTIYMDHWRNEMCYVQSWLWFCAHSIMDLTN